MEDSIIIPVTLTVAVIVALVKIFSKKSKYPPNDLVELSEKNDPFLLNKFRKKY